MFRNLKSETAYGNDLLLNLNFVNSRTKTRSKKKKSNSSYWKYGTYT